MTKISANTVMKYATEVAGGMKIDANVVMEYVNEAATAIGNGKSKTFNIKGDAGVVIEDEKAYYAQLFEIAAGLAADKEYATLFNSMRAKCQQRGEVKA